MAGGGRGVAPSARVVAYRPHQELSSSVVAETDDGGVPSVARIPMPGALKVHVDGDGLAEDNGGIG